MAVDQTSRHEIYDSPTVPGIFMRQAARFGTRVLKLSKQDGRWQETSWQAARENLRRTAMGLVASGIRTGDRVGIVSATRSEWSDADLAILAAGAVVVGIYPTASPREQEQIIRHSGCRLVFVENDDLIERILTIRKGCGLPERLVAFVTNGAHLADGVTSFAQFKQEGDAADRQDPARFDSLWRAVKPDDIATIAYTSGTTGPPKGALITHANLYFTAINAASTQNLTAHDFGIAYLPLAHMLQRVSVYAALHAGIRGVYAESIDRLIDNFRELKPTIQVGVPRVFEKVHARIMQAVAEGPPWKRWLFTWAMATGRLTSPYRMAGLPLPLPLAIAHALADRLVLAKIRGLFGGRVKHLISGSAPLSMELLEFYYAAGLLILEGYGLTETVAPVSVNRPGHFKFGTVGTLIDGIEARLGEGGELLVRGRGLFRGYYRDPAATAEAIDADGWFRTGDIARIDGEGFITITDRRKEIVITAGGKNIAPQNIEHLLRSHPCISHAMVHGDRRKYLTALITLDEARTLAFVRREKTPTGSPEHLSAHPAIRALVGEHVAVVNARLAPYEQIRRFAILPRDFTEAAGELTPTLKIRRKEIARIYQDLLDSLYD